jgi:hypothetical protein
MFITFSEIKEKINNDNKNRNVSFGKFYTSLGKFHEPLGKFYASLGKFYASLGKFYASLGKFHASLGKFYAFSVYNNSPFVNTNSLLENFFSSFENNNIHIQNKTNISIFVDYIPRKNSELVIRSSNFIAIVASNATS